MVHVADDGAATAVNAFVVDALVADVRIVILVFVIVLAQLLFCYDLYG